MGGANGDITVEVATFQIASAEDVQAQCASETVALVVRAASQFIAAVVSSPGLNPVDHNLQGWERQIAM